MSERAATVNSVRGGPTRGNYVPLPPPRYGRRLNFLCAREKVTVPRTDGFLDTVTRMQQPVVAVEGKGKTSNVPPSTNENWYTDNIYI